MTCRCCARNCSPPMDTYRKSIRSRTMKKKYDAVAVNYIPPPGHHLFGYGDGKIITIANIEDRTGYVDISIVEGGMEDYLKRGIIDRAIEQALQVFGIEPSSVNWQIVPGLDVSMRNADGSRGRAKQRV